MARQFCTFGGCRNPAAVQTVTSPITGEQEQWPICSRCLPEVRRQESEDYAERHGRFDGGACPSVASFFRHQRRGETCEACKQAKRDYDRAADQRRRQAR